MDPLNAAFPVPVTRRTGGFTFQELLMLDYPYFPDIRAPNLNPDSIITSGLPQVTLAWASPIELDAEMNAGAGKSPNCSGPRRRAGFPPPPT